jgi:hypothetical protein
MSSGTASASPIPLSRRRLALRALPLCSGARTAVTTNSPRQPAAQSSAMRGQGVERPFLPPHQACCQQDTVASTSSTLVKASGPRRSSGSSSSKGKLTASSRSSQPPTVVQRGGKGAGGHTAVWSQTGWRRSHKRTQKYLLGPIAAPTLKKRLICNCLSESRNPVIQLIKN